MKIIHYLCPVKLFLVMQITDNFSLEELLRSTRALELGIDNTQPPYEIIVNLVKLVVLVLQPLREHFGEPVIISSGYRCPRLNQAVGGVANSQHIYGQAVDIYLGGDSAKEAEYFRYIRQHLPYDQLILEGNEKSSWLHVSYVSTLKNRKQSWIQLQKTSGQ